MNNYWKFIGNRILLCFVFIIIAQVINYALNWILKIFKLTDSNEMRKFIIGEFVILIISSIIFSFSVIF